jgi:Dolichyl-phosphate-mannose-protein mannosyltransferase
MGEQADSLPLPPAEAHFLLGERLSGVRLLGMLAALLCVAWALLDHRFRDSEGFPTGQIVVPMALGLAVLVLAWAGASVWSAAARWLAVILLGQAVGLQLIDAGQLIHYQHYRLDSSNAVWLSLVVVQTALVAAGMRDRRRAVLAWLRRVLPGWRLAVLGGIILISAAALSRDPLAYATELPFATFVELVNLGAVVLLAAAIPADALPALGQRLDTWLGVASVHDTAEPGGVDRFALLAAAWVTGVCAVLSAFIYERHPHVPDEVIYLYPARYFAQGMLTMPAPPVPAAFELYLMDVVNGRWFSPVQPGWPALLTVGIWLDVPWLVNPILAGINILLAYLVLREVYDRRTTRLITLLACASPWFVFTGMSFMTHMATLACALGPIVLLVRAQRTGKVHWALLAGGLVGAGALIRQLDGFLVGLVLGLWLVGSAVAVLRRGAGGWQRLVRDMVVFGVGAGVVAALWIPINLYFAGSPTAFPLEVYLDRTFGPGRNALGFGPDRGLGWPLEPLPGHSPLKALLNGLLNVFSVNIELLGWATGSMILIGALAVSGRMGRREWLALGVVAAVVGTYSLYWYSGGPDFAARYWFVAFPAFVVLVARGLQVLEREFPVRVPAVVVTLCALAVAVYIPWRALDKYHHYLHMRPDLPAIAQARGFGRSLVVVRGDEQPDYASAIIYNPLDLQSDAPVYVHARGSPVDQAIVQAYVDRPIWIVDGPTLTHAGYEVVAGPLAAPDALSQLQSPPTVAAN